MRRLPAGMPAGAVEFTYPRGGYGVIFRQG
jgi:ferredoxin-like protein FixX